MICNVPPFEVHNVYGCGIVDFKMCKALTKGEVNLDAYQWVMGNRPKDLDGQESLVLYQALTSHSRVLHRRS